MNLSVTGISLLQKKVGTSKNADTYILHNTGSKQIGRSNYIDELNTFKTKCSQCKTIVQEVRSLLEIKSIKKNEVVGVCEHCKRSSSLSNTCKRCDFLVSEFISEHERRWKENQQRFKEWLCKIIYVLQAKFHGIRTCNCPPIVNKDADLERILNVLKEPLRKPEAGIDYFPNLNKEKLMSESKEMLDEIFTKKKFDGRKPLPSEAKCLCKFLKENFLGQISGVDLIKPKYPELSLGHGISKDHNKNMVQGILQKPNNAIAPDIGEDKNMFLGSDKISSKSAMHGGTRSKSAKHGDTSSKSPKHDDTRSKSPKHGDTSSKSSKHGDSTNRSLSESKVTISKSTLKKTLIKENVRPADENNILTRPKSKKNTTLSETLFQKLLKSTENSKLQKQRQLEMNTKRLKDQLSKKSVKIEGNQIRQLVMTEKKPIPSSLILDEMGSESTLVCEVQETVVPKLKISGDKVIHLNTNYKDIEKPLDREPLLFKTKFEFEDIDPITTLKSEYPSLPNDGGKLIYQLSKDEFIHKGWTILPIQKMMRRMYVYRMKPANPKNCWFNRHKHLGKILYDTGENMADIDPEGRGCWYYRNGTIALEYYNAEEYNVGQRVVVYSCRTENVFGEITPRTILALFDGLGNGVVYDEKGKLRLKYNQSEGVVVDPKIGPPCKWKWHTLNEPPVFEEVITETYLEERDPRLDEILEPSNSIDAVEVQRPVHPEMLEIELNNFIKEKTCKLKQKFRPFKIRMKVVKLNAQFTLKILDQAKIYLLYRDGCTIQKLNLGLLLDCNEIIDTVTLDLADIATPYDKRPAKTKSVENIQKILHSVRSGKTDLPSELTIKLAFD